MVVGSGDYSTLWDVIMRYVLSGLGVLATVTLMVVSASMNWSYQHAQGYDAFDADVLGAGSIGVDILKSLTPLFVGWAWAHRKIGLALLGAIGFCLFFGFSLLSALGFSASNRGTIVGVRETVTARYASVADDLNTAGRRLNALGAQRPSRVIAEAIIREQQDRRWTSSQGCTAATAEGSRTFCKSVGDLKIELASSEEAERLAVQVLELKAKLLDLKQSGAGQVSDPQADVIAKIVPGATVDRAKIGLSIFFALLIEFGAAFGLVISTGFLQRPKRGPISGEIMPATDSAAKRGKPASDALARRQRPLRIDLNRDGALIVDGESD